MTSTAWRGSNVGRHAERLRIVPARLFSRGVTAVGPAVGSRGKAVTELKPGGSAEFLDAAGGSHIVAVVSDAGFVDRGTPLIVREAFSSGPERPSLYILYAGMIGLGPVLRYAESRQQQRENDQ